MTDERIRPGDHEDVRAIAGGPFSSFTAPVTMVTDQLKVDGLSRPQVAVRLRRWAMTRGDVLRLVVGHTGRHYTVAALLHDPTYEDLCDVQRQLAQLGLLGGLSCEVYAFSPARADASVLTSFGNLTIHDAAAEIRQTESSRRVAAST